MILPSDFLAALAREQVHTFLAEAQSAGRTRPARAGRSPARGQRG